MTRCPLRFLMSTAARQFRRPRPCCIDDDPACNLDPVGQPHAPLPDLDHRCPQAKLRPAFLRPLHQKPSRARRIQHRILSHEQTARHALAQVGLEAPQRLRVEHRRRNSALRVVIVLAPHFGHLFFVSRDPDRSALVVLDIAQQFRAQRLPELLRVAREGKLRVGVIHHHDVAHPGSRGAASHYFPVDDRNAHAAPRKLVRASRAHDPGAHNDHVIGCGVHRSGCESRLPSMRHFDVSHQRWRQFDD